MPLCRLKQVLEYRGLTLRAEDQTHSRRARWLASCPLFCRSLRRMRMCFVSLTYPYPLHTFPSDQDAPPTSAHHDDRDLNDLYHSRLGDALRRL